MPDPNTLICLFHSTSAATAAVHDLQALGLSGEEVAVIGDARTGLAGETPTATLQAMHVPDADAIRLMDGLRDGGTIVAVRTTAALAPQIEEIFASHSAGLIDEKIIDTNDEKIIDTNDAQTIGANSATTDHFTSRITFDTHEPNRLDSED